MLALTLRHLYAGLTKLAVEELPRLIKGPIIKAVAEALRDRICSFFALTKRCLASANNREQDLDVARVIRRAGGNLLKADSERLEVHPEAHLALKEAGVEMPRRLRWTYVPPAAAPLGGGLPARGLSPLGGVTCCTCHGLARCVSFYGSVLPPPPPSPSLPQGSTGGGGWLTSVGVEAVSLRLLRRGGAGSMLRDTEGSRKVRFQVNLDCRACGHVVDGDECLGCAAQLGPCVLLSVPSAVYAMT